MRHTINKIPISWLHSQAYCEYQLYLEQVKGLKLRASIEMQEGRRVHAALEENHKKKAKLRLSVIEALKKAKKEKVKLIGREIKVEGSKLYGFIDEVHLMPTKILIIDDKPNEIAYLTNKKQVWGYCLAFQEQFAPNLPIIGCVRQRDNQQIVWKEIFSEEHKNIVVESIKRIFEILEGIKNPKPPNNPNKCRSCRFKEVCKKKI